MSSLRTAAGAAAIAAALGACDSLPNTVGACCGYAVEVIIPTGTCSAASPDGGSDGGPDGGPGDAGCGVAGAPILGDSCTESVRVALQCRFPPITCYGSPGELWCGSETDPDTAQSTASSFQPLLDAGWPKASAQANCNCIDN
jgi:hypothetical protein